METWSEEQDMMAADLIAEEKEGSILDGKIYYLFLPDGYFYIGCTKLSLARRLEAHKFLSETKNCPFYDRVKYWGGWNGVVMKLAVRERVTRAELYKLQGDEIYKNMGHPLCMNVFRPRPVVVARAKKQPPIAKAAAGKVKSSRVDKFKKKKRKQHGVPYHAEYYKDPSYTTQREIRTEKRKCPNCDQLRSHVNMSVHMKSRTCINMTAERRRGVV